MKSDEPSTGVRAAWQREAGRIARKINVGWWLDGLTPPIVAVGLAGACALLLLRRAAPEISLWQLGLGVGLALALAAGVGWLIARRRFESPEQTMVRIESTMLLSNALTAARAEVAPWPEIPERIDAGVDWNWRRILVPPVAALALLLGGLFIPVSASDRPATSAANEPLAWEQIEADLERLGEDDVIDESQLEETRKKLEELRAQDEDEWFSHSSLEATDSLKQQQASEVNRLERDLRQAGQALGNLARQADQMPQARQDQLLNQFDQALQGLQNGALKPNRELLDQLRQLDPENLGQLDPNQLQQLRENLQKAGQACKDCQGGGQNGEGDGQGNEWLDELLEQGDDPNRPAEQGGRGGINRGPAAGQPGVLGRESDPLKTGDLAGLEAKDLSRSLPGELLQLQDGEHQIDQSPSAPRAGGDLETTGTGGERIWRDTLDPDEQRALKRCFE